MGKPFKCGSVNLKRTVSPSGTWSLRGNSSPVIAPAVVTSTVADALAVPLVPVQARLNVLVLANTPVDALPEVNLTPDQPSEAAQEVAFVDDQIRVEDSPLAIDAGFAASDTVGSGVGGVVVVKLQVKLDASALPAASLASVRIIAVYCVLPTRFAEGVNVAVLPLTFTVPLTATSPEVVASLKVAVVNVELVIASEKVVDTEEFSATPVAVLVGEVADTVGGVVSGAAAVANCQLKSAASALPAASFASLVMVAVNCVLPAREAVGLKVTVLPLTLTVPVIGLPPAVGLRVKLAALSVEFVIASVKVADTEEFSATPVAALAGDVEDTVGGA